MWRWPELFIIFSFEVAQILELRLDDVHTCIHYIKPHRFFLQMQSLRVAGMKG